MVLCSQTQDIVRMAHCETKLTNVTTTASSPGGTTTNPVNASHRIEIATMTVMGPKSRQERRFGIAPSSSPLGVSDSLSSTAFLMAMLLESKCWRSVSLAVVIVIDLWSAEHTVS